MSLARILGDEGFSAWMIDALNERARLDPAVLDACLVTVGEPTLIAETRATVRCHFVARNAHGRPVVKKLARTLAHQITNYCIPRQRIEEAKEHLLKTGSVSEFARLQDEARELFSDLDTSGEGGELLLYTMLESILGVPQILCKMPLKTNPRMHVHGVDGVHARVLDNGNLALYWGESKVHARVSDAIDECFESISPFLVGDEEESRRDLLLVRDNLDLGDNRLTAALIDFFDDRNPRSNAVEVRAACLVGFDIANYPEPHDESGAKIVDAVAKKIARWHERIADRIADHELEAIEMEVFCIPMPSVDKFRSALKERLGLS